MVVVMAMVGVAVEETVAVTAVAVMAVVGMVVVLMAEEEKVEVVMAEKMVG